VTGKVSDGVPQILQFMQHEEMISQPSLFIDVTHPRIRMAMHGWSMSCVVESCTMRPDQCSWFSCLIIRCRNNTKES
jgi:hypothetical protein